MRHIVDQQLVPLLRGVTRPAPEVFGVVDLGPFEDAMGPAIIIGIDERVEEIEPLLALLALDPETRIAPIVIAAATEIIDRVGVQIRRLADFYRLRIRLVSANGSEDLYDALEVGARTVTTDQVVFLAGSCCRERLAGSTSWSLRMKPIKTVCSLQPLPMKMIQSAGQGRGLQDHNRIAPSSVVMRAIRSTPYPACR